MTGKTVLVSTRIVMSYSMKQGILFWVWQKLWDNNKIRISQWREGYYTANTSVRRKKEIQKSRFQRITVRDPSRKVKHLSKVIRGRIIITELTMSISFTKIGYSVLMMDVKVTKEKHISWCVDQDNLIYKRWNSIKNRA